VGGLATFPGLPSTAVPLARTSEGLPTGMQVVGNLYEDRTTLAFADLLQAEGLSA
jgi:amidase